ncbi:MAG: hypothetical protein AB2758_17725 [Candidatus Thiodiazotropha endolucinida]
MIEIGTALFGAVGAWIAAIWLSASVKKIRAAICIAIYAALSLALFLRVEGIVPGLAGSAIGVLTWIAFRQTLIERMGQRRQAGSVNGVYR